MALVRILLVLLCAASLSGCVSTRFLYNQADWLTVWYVDSLFDLSREQKDELREMVDRNFAWHREHQLPRYAEFCVELDREVAGDVTPEMLELRYQKMLVIWDEFLAHVMPDVSRFLQGLTDEQVEDFLANVEKNNEEIWEEYAGSTPEKRLERRQKAAVKGMQRFTGRLNDGQEQLIHEYIATMHDNSAEWMVTRRQWQADFQALLRERPPEPGFSERLSGLMLDPNKADSAEYRVKVEENRRIIFEMFAAVSNQLTEGQRDRLGKRLRNYAEDFEMLAEQV